MGFAGTSVVVFPTIRLRSLITQCQVDRSGWTMYIAWAMKRHWLTVHTVVGAFMIVVTLRMSSCHALYVSLCCDDSLMI